MDLEEFIAKYEKIDFGEIINQVIKKNEKKIVELNTKKQLYEAGIKNTGARITPPYAKSTIKQKRSKGQPTDRVTLRDKGGYHAGFFIIYEKDQITIESKAITKKSFNLSEHLAKRYGKEVKGLTNLNIDELRELILPDLQKAIAEI